MQSLNVYTVQDLAGVFYHRPFFTQNDATARRLCSAMANDPNSECYRSPSDFNLLHIGYWDDESGALDPCTPAHVCNFISLKDED